MGIIRAIRQTIGGTLADQWLEVIEPENMGDQTVLTAGIRTGKGANRKGGKDSISNGSVIHVYEGQFMMLLDGGRIVDYSAEPGYFTVDNSSMPSMFSGSLDDVVKNSFDRFRFGGTAPTSQKVLYLNLQEIKGIRFGTRNPISYFDNFYNAELFLRAHGTYSIRITDPIKFYVEAIPKNKDQVEITDINEQYLYEFLDALQSSINQMSADGMRISYVQSKSRELSKYMAETLDEDWKQTRGMEIQAVAIASLSYDDKSQELLNMRNQGAMLQDPSIREGYMQGAFARGMEAAGSNANGSTMGFMGMQMGAQMGGNMAASMSAANQQQMIRNQQMQQEAATAHRESFFVIRHFHDSRMAVWVVQWISDDLVIRAGMIDTKIRHTIFCLYKAVVPRSVNPLFFVGFQYRMPQFRPCMRIQQICIFIDIHHSHAVACSRRACGKSQKNISAMF